jgi:hypothetical protein
MEAFFTFTQHAKVSIFRLLGQWSGSCPNIQPVPVRFAKSGTEPEYCNHLRARYAQCRRRNPSIVGGARRNKMFTYFKAEVLPYFRDELHFGIEAVVDGQRHCYVMQLSFSMLSNKGVLDHLFDDCKRKISAEIERCAANAKETSAHTHNSSTTPASKQASAD